MKTLAVTRATLDLLPRLVSIRRELLVIRYLIKMRRHGTDAHKVVGTDAA
jgi:hypothetical protein